MLNTNSWNKFRYTLYLPIYDQIVRVFRKYREKSIGSLNINSDDNVLILGAGTGLDLEFLKGCKNITAIDITPGMISQLKFRASELNLPVNAQVMDGSNLEFEDASFDVVILHLIVAVIPDAVSCLKEAERVLKPGGKFTIMDKFVHSGKRPSLLRRLLNPVSIFLATNLNRDVDELLSNTSLQKTHHEKLGSIFWLIQGQKPA